MNPLRHSLDCFSAYPYPPRRDRRGNRDKRFLQLIYDLKHGNQFETRGQFVSPYWFVATNHAGNCAELAGAVVVPIPRSSVTPVDVRSTLWPGLRLAESLVTYGTAKEMRSVLRRVVAVPTASQSSGSGRPTVQRHIDSFRVDVRPIAEAEHVVLVDDMLTRGTQLIGAMQAIRLAGYRGTISGFTAGYTDYGDRASPRRCAISWVDGDEHASTDLAPNTPFGLDL